MDPLLEAMRSIESQKQIHIKQECSAFMEQLRRQLPSLLHPSHLYTDGALYLPIKEGCAPFVLQELHTYRICYSNMTSPKNKCIRIGLSDDHSHLHAVPLSHSCEYIKRIFNQ